MPAYDPTEAANNRTCNYSYVRQRDLPPDQKNLLACSKCKEVFYIDRDAQRKDWKMHKRVCCSLENDDPRLQEPIEMFIECVSTLEYIFEDPMNRIRGRMLLHAMKELKRIVSTPPKNGRKVDHEDDVQEFVIQPFRQCVQQYGEVFIALVWSIPGFACYCLSDEILMSPILAWRKQNGLPAVLPSDTAAMKRLPNYQLSAPYCQFLTQLFTATGSLADGSSSKQEAALVAATIRTNMECWSSDYVRASFSMEQRAMWHYMSFRAGFADDQIHALAKDNELVPGLTAKALLQNLMADKNFVQNLQRQALIPWLNGFYAMDAMDEDPVWRKHLTPEDRLELLDLSHDWKPPTIPMYDPTWPRQFTEALPDHFTDVRTSVIHLITGTSTDMLLKMHDLLIEQPSRSDDRTFRMVRGIYNDLEKLAMPNVSLGVNLLEQRYQKHMEASQDEARSFPEVLLHSIAEYTFAPNYAFASRASPGKGLRFATDEELQQYKKRIKNL